MYSRLRGKPFVQIRRDAKVKLAGVMFSRFNATLTAGIQKDTQGYFTFFTKKLKGSEETKGVRSQPPTIPTYI